MLKINIEKEMKGLTRYIDDIARKQVPYATSRALNQVTKDAKQAEIETMKRVFNNPVRYTLNSLRLKFSTKSNLKTEIAIEEYGGKGTSPSDYLTPNIRGGFRKPKRSEKLLYNIGKLGAGQYITPGSAARLTGSGKVSSGWMQQVLSGLKAQTDSRQNSRGGKASRYFIGKPGRGAFGIYEHVGRAIRCVFKVINKAPNYKKRYPFNETCQNTVRNNFPTAFSSAMKQAMATARK